MTFFQNLIVYDSLVCRLSCRRNEKKYIVKLSKEQGRIHDQLSRVRLGRGSDEIDQPSSWAGAVTSKPPVNAEKAKRDGQTDRRTDGPTDRRTERVVESRARD